ncbi:MAG: hypothetical protein J6A88_08710 [Oscillospiraceae bacterium]|nr:hypothetical protein [Oscillospiraceae bacterium]
MLIVNKNLNAEDIRGKKYRSPDFSLSAIFSIPFILLAIFVSANIPPREGQGVIIGLVLVVLLALPAALLLSSLKTSYIICKDRIYFFNSQVIRLKNEKRKKESRIRTNGSVGYSDIKNFRYLGIEFSSMGGPLRKYISPPRVVIIGDDFEVEVCAYKSLINRIKALQR